MNSSFEIPYFVYPCFLKIITYFLNRCPSPGKGDSQLSLSESTMAKLRKTRDIVEKIIDEGHVRYGISTGFGSLSKVVVDKDNLVELQYNIIRCKCML